MSPATVEPGPARRPAWRPAPRIAALDLLRGVAVLGILAVNIAGFAGPIASTDSPALLLSQTGHYGQAPAPFAEEAAFAGVFILFEGKMRAIFSMLFGASMLLFISRAEAAGRNGFALQWRRLGWLALFGTLHYVLLWWGDILFVYALAGMCALMLSALPGRMQLGLAAMIFAVWHGGMALSGLLLDLAEEHVRLGLATLAEHGAVAGALADTHRQMALDLTRDHQGFLSAATARLTTAPLWPLQMAQYTLGETLPLMLLGMALYRGGFFAGAWPRPRLWALAAGGLALGGGWVCVLLAWAWARHFPMLAMSDVLAYWAGPEHLAMALAYMALLMLAAPALLASWPGRRLAAAGRMAFSNYLGTSLVMCFAFHGWGLALEGSISRPVQLGFVLAGWAIMLAWSAPWLTRFRQGPLEWLWRSLTDWRRMPVRR